MYSNRSIITIFAIIFFTLSHTLYVEDKQARPYQMLHAYFEMEFVCHLQNVELGKYFEKKVRSDERFEVAAPRHLGLIVFRLREGGDSRTGKLLKRLNRDGRVHMVPASLKGVYVIR